jgi:hypothetical protein
MSHKSDSSRRSGRTGSGFPPGGIGDLSVRVGYDVRDLIMEGYSWDEIHDVAGGRYSLAELRRRGPRSKGRAGMRAKAIDEFNLRVSVAPLARTILLDPESGQIMLILERKATVTDHARPHDVQVRAQPLGGASEILDPAALREHIGHLHYDSEESAEKRDFRILIRASEWEDLQRFVAHCFLHPGHSPFETEPHREVAEELENTLGLEITPSFFQTRAISPLVQNEPTSGCAPSSGQKQTVRLYHIHNVEITHAPLVRAILRQSREMTDEKLAEQARRDLQSGQLDSGRANAPLALPLEAMLEEIQQSPGELSRSILQIAGREMYENVLAVLFWDLRPELRAMTSFSEISHSE